MAKSHRQFLTVDTAGKHRLYQPQSMPGWDAVGTVMRGNGEVGALVRNCKTGIYCQANAGTLKSLPQNKVIAALASQE